jgi:nucleotide-binding universal stress UspA family protein
MGALRSPRSVFAVAYAQVLVGIDGREGGRDALALAQQLAPDAALTLATIAPSDPRPWRGANGEYDAAQRAEAQTTLEAERAAADVSAELVIDADPEPGRGLHRIAEAQATDLLIVGSTRHGLLGRVCLGDNTRAALDGAPCTLAVAPVDYRTDVHDLRRVGVGFDGSPESERALAVAHELAAANGAELTALNVVRVPAVFAGGGRAPLAISVAALLAESDEELAAKTGTTARSVYGQPAEELSLFSRSLDLLVVGSRGLGPVGRLVYGSTTRLLARHVHCPLLVVPRPAT